MTSPATIGNICMVNDQALESRLELGIFETVYRRIEILRQLFRKGEHTAYGTQKAD